VMSHKMTKTLVVRVDTLKKHPKYQKFYRTSKKFKVHDEKGEYRKGDIVMIAETRPISKEKRWVAVELVKRSSEVEAGIEEKDQEKA
ncbi:MAG: 30S ribosomal protein S17, partial [Candidatus Sungbacteria bacterium]|nr:30S ribosomal protein S17 [Candidatus Sungbacteria bacterium]